MRLRGAKGRPHRCGIVSMHGNETDGGGVNVDIFAYHTLMVAVGFVNRLPFAVIVKCFDSEGFEHTAREAEGGVIIVGAAEKRCRDVEHQGVALGVFAVKVAVNDKAEG